MRGLLLSLCLAHLRADSWQLLRMSLASSSGDRLGSVPGAGAVRAISWTDASFARGRWSGIGNVGCTRIHQRSIYLAGTGFPALGQSALQLARCGLCTVLKAGTRRWERAWRNIAWRKLGESLPLLVLGSHFGICTGLKRPSINQILAPLTEV